MHGTTKTDSVKIETAAEMMTHPAYCLDAEMNVVDAAERLVDKHIHGAPVVDADGRLLGIISDSDLLRVQIASAFHAVPTGPVTDHMSTEPVTIDAEADIYAVTRLFQTGEASRLPVMKDGKCVGIITRRNLLRALQRLSRFHDKETNRTYELLARLRGA
ncbi:MAG: CBS domain-containing protein [Myxococcales bacterium]|nr:CBS domain-containing protein [Myxococcales bacterium]